MKQFLLATLTACLSIVPANATPQWPGYTNAGQCAGDMGSGCRYTLEIVNPSEKMLIVSGLEFLGASRFSTVQHCVEITGVTDYRNLTTDDELESMEFCLNEHS